MAPVLSSVTLFAQQDGVPRQMVLHVVRLWSPSLQLTQVCKVVAEKLVWRAMASVDGVSDMAVRASTLGTCIPSYDWLNLPRRTGLRPLHAVTSLMLPVITAVGRCSCVCAPGTRDCELQ